MKNKIYAQAKENGKKAKTIELKPYFLGCVDELLQLDQITPEMRAALVAGIERDDKNTYQKITMLLVGYADRMKATA